jgi:hypothetical protein
MDANTINADNRLWAVQLEGRCEHEEITAYWFQAAMCAKESRKRENVNEIVHSIF